MQRRYSLAFILTLTVVNLVLSGCGGSSPNPSPKIVQSPPLPPPIPPIKTKDYTVCVDPLIGSYPPGFTNPGAASPRGMVTLGPDTEGPVNYGGYSVQNSRITGFSHVHMSAGVPQGGQLPILPITGAISTDDPYDAGYPNPVPAYASAFDKSSELAIAGYYAVNLVNYSVNAELTSTQHGGMHRYTFANPSDNGIIVDVSRDLKGYHPARLHIDEDGTLLGEVTTSSPEHTIYFALKVNQSYTLEDLAGEVADKTVEHSGDRLGFVLRFDGEPTEVLVKAAISFVDSAGALNNLDSEIPDWDFDNTYAVNKLAWNQRLSAIDVTGGSQDQCEAFYTALYRTAKFPHLLSDVDGRYRIEDQVLQASSPRYTQFSLWDSYRGHNQLMAELWPDEYHDMILSMLDYHQVSGKLPRWQLGPKNPGYMSGDPAVPFIGEGWCRGLLSDAEQTRAWDAITNTFALRDDDIQLGYKPTGQPDHPAHYAEGGPRDAGTTLEFALADFSASAMAHSVGNNGDAAQRESQSLNYRNLFDSETGWIRPKDADGEWITPFQPEAGYGFQEGTSWQYSWLAMHDLAGLFERMETVESVEQRLDQFFGFGANMAPMGWSTAQNQTTAFGLVYYGNQYAPGNEHDLHAPYLYNYAGAAWKTQIAAASAASIYTGETTGLPGNDDLGALSGWLVWTMLGVYPMNPGLPLFTIGSPVFEKAIVQRPQGNLVIDAAGASPVAGYVVESKLNQQASDLNWFILPRTETELSLTVSATPDPDWGSSAPPSLSTHQISDFGCAI